MINKAETLLAEGKVNRVLGWKKGEFCYDVTPAIFADAEAMKKDFVFGSFCGANFSKYLVEETRKDGKILVFLKPCDTYSFNQLLTEHRFDREKVYAVGVPCDGMLDIGNIKAILGDGILGATVEGDTVKVETIYDGDINFQWISFPYAKCASDFFGNDDAAQVIDASYNARCFHIYFLSS